MFDGCNKNIKQIIIHVVRALWDDFDNLPKEVMVNILAAAADLYECCVSVVFFDWFSVDMEEMCIVGGYSDIRDSDFKTATFGEGEDLFKTCMMQYSICPDIFRTPLDFEWSICMELIDILQNKTKDIFDIYQKHKWKEGQ